MPHEHDMRTALSPALRPPVQPPRRDAKKVQVLRIPPHGSAPVNLVLDPITIDDKCTHDAETAASEASALHAPDIPSCKGAAFDWRSRYLVHFVAGGDAVPRESRGHWYMYKCRTPGFGLGPNRNPLFEKGGQVLAFGDVFVFRRKGDGYDGLGRVRYAAEWSLPKEEIARIILGEMAWS